MIKYDQLSLQNTLFVGKDLWHFPQLDSTNSFAQSLLTKTTPSDGTVISTYQQTDGKGQIGSTWESEAEKNITLSIILYPHFLLPKQQFWLTKVTALGVRQFIADCVSQEVYIKWPNDIYIKDKKTSGILIQNTLSASTIQSTIVGIGLNVNQTNFSPALPNPTSLQLSSQLVYDLDALRAQLCAIFEQYYLQLRAGKLQSIHQEYLNHLYRINQLASYESSDGQSFNGIIRGISENGQLQVEHNGRLKNFDLKAIRFR